MEKEPKIEIISRETFEKMLTMKTRKLAMMAKQLLTQFQDFKELQAQYGMDKAKYILEFSSFENGGLSYKVISNKKVGFDL